MSLFGAFRRRRAVRKYARRLPRQLYRDYGASQFFTPGQIRAAVARLKIDPAFIVYGYAMFLPEAAFNELRPQMQSQLSYQRARAELLRHVPSKLSGSDNSVDFNWDWSQAPLNGLPAAAAVEEALPVRGCFAPIRGSGG